MLWNLQDIAAGVTCRPWEFEQEKAGQGKGYRRKLKGHKHDKIAAARYAGALVCF